LDSQHVKARRLLEKLTSSEAITNLRRDKM
jgi:hypothetical protein